MVDKSGAGAVARVVVPVEGSSQELVVQEWAVEVARQLDVGVRAVHVAAPGKKPPGDLFKYASDLAKRRGVPFASKILEGSDAVREIIEELGPRDIVVIGTRLLGTEYHLGSFTEALVRGAPCPVQVVRIR